VDLSYGPNFPIAHLRLPEFKRGDMPDAIDFADDIIPRAPGHLRVATFNVENLFSRPVAMDYEDHSVGQPFLDAFNELNAIFGKDVYDVNDKQRILDLLDEHKLLATRPPPNKHPRSE